MDPWRDRPLEKRPKNERKFSMKNPVDRTIVFVVGGVALALIVIAIVILLLINLL